MGGSSSRLLTLVFTDLAASTALKSEKGDVAASEIISRHRNAIKAAASEHGGRVIDWAGDGCFLTFETPSAAVAFALDVQAAHRADSSLPPVRIGIHIGEVMQSVGDGATRVEGLAVDLSARIQSLAVPGQILLSTEVFNSARQLLRAGHGDSELAWRAHGPYVLKGFDDPVGICEVGYQGAAPLTAPPNSEKASRAVQPHEEAAFGWRPAVGLGIPARAHWALEKQLGTGGFGEVWLAENSQSHERHVFKFCFEPDRIRGLKREVVLFNILKQKLGSHEGIARLLDWELESPPYFIEAEYTEGGDLKEWAAQRGGLDQIPLKTRIDIAAQVASALADAHKAGVLHKDIKPANVLIRGSESAPHAVITDFGIGLLLDAQVLKRGLGATGLTKTLLSASSSSTSGTAMYIAPEIVEGKLPSERSDIYALGVMLYQLIVGDFSRALAPGWERDIEDPLLREDIARCIDGKPENRFAHCDELAQRLRAIPQRARSLRAASQRKIALRVAALAAVIVLLAAGAAAYAARLRQQREARDRETWARTEALPQLSTLVDDFQFIEAFALGQQIAQIIPDDPALKLAMQSVSARIAIQSTPPGAAVYFKPYTQPEADWIQAGVTPIEGLELGQGVYRWRLELDGYEPRESVEIARNPQMNVHRAMPMNLYKDPYTLEFALHKAEEIPAGMIPIEAASIIPALLGASAFGATYVPEFFMDRTEVTNAQYLEFVESGGYEKQEYWHDAFVRDGVEVSWEEARRLFIDQTGRPGPSTWELGKYPAGQENYPVGGLSWFEASAYARFRGKELPTLYHWLRAALPRFELAEPLSPLIIAQSNLDGTGPAPVESFAGMGFGGIRDAAGNVREWCRNSSRGNRIILGAGWSEVAYAFSQAGVMSPWDRSAINGLRCMLPAPGKEIPRPLTADVVFFGTTGIENPPVSEEVFAAVKNLYRYDRGPTNARIQSTDEEVMPGLVHQVVRMDSPAAEDDLIVHVFLPKNQPPPYPAVLFFGGVDCLIARDLLESPYITYMDFVPRSGRAFVFPCYKGAYDRNDGRSMAVLSRPQAMADLIADWIKEIGRTIDYIEEREDLDNNRLAYMGLSLGAGVGNQVMAIEKRLTSAIMLSGGLTRFSRYEGQVVGQPDFIRRIEVPVLLISGRYDYMFPLEETQVPFMELLATPAEDKRHVVLDAGHAPLPRLPLMNETLAWLDKYQPLPAYDAAK